MSTAKLDYLKKYMPSKTVEKKKRERKLLEKLENCQKQAMARQAAMPARKQFVEMKDDESNSSQSS